MPSTTICLAAVAIAMSPEAHWRSIVMPGTVTPMPARNSGLPGDVVAAGPFLHRTAEDDVLDLLGINPGALDGRTDGMGRQRLRLGVVERASVGLPDGGTGGRDDDCFAHGGSPVDEGEEVVDRGQIEMPPSTGNTTPVT